MKKYPYFVYTSATSAAQETGNFIIPILGWVSLGAQVNEDIPPTGDLNGQASQLTLTDLYKILKEGVNMTSP